MLNKIISSICLSLITLSSCSNIDDSINNARGIVKLNDDGSVERSFCWVWKTLTGHTLGKSLKDLAASDDVSDELIVIMLQNYIEKAHMMGATREQAIESLLVKAGYDDKYDGRIRISKITKDEVKRRLKELERKKRAYLKNST